MRFIVALPLVIASCFSAHAQSDLSPPEATYVARCEVRGGAAPPRGTIEGSYKATYHFTSVKPANCDEAAKSALLTIMVTEGTGFQRYELPQGADSQKESSYKPNPIAKLVEFEGTAQFRHELVQVGEKKLPGWINAHTGAVCTANKIGPLNTPSGNNAAELVLRIQSCPTAFFDR